MRFHELRQIRLRQQELELRNQREEFAQLGADIREPRRDVARPVGPGLDDAADHVRREFREDRRPLLQNHFNPPHAEQAEHAPQQEVEKQRQRNRQRSPQPVPPDRRLRKCAQQIMPHDIEAVRKRNAGEHQDRLRLRCPAEPVVQDHRFDQPIQDRHRKPGVEERIRHPLPRDEIVPLEQRRTPQPAAGQHRLDNVPHPRDAEPDHRTEIGQEPPVVGTVIESQERRQKPDQDLDRDLDVAVQVVPVFAERRDRARQRTLGRRGREASQRRKIPDAAVDGLRRVRTLPLHPDVVTEPETAADPIPEAVPLARQAAELPVDR